MENNAETMRYGALTNSELKDHIKKLRSQQALFEKKVNKFTTEFHKLPTNERTTVLSLLSDLRNKQQYLQDQISRAEKTLSHRSLQTPFDEP